MRLFLILLMLTGSTVIQAAEATPAEQTIREELSVLAPDLDITRIRPAPIDGLYEVVIGTNVIYTTADGRYVLRGELLDLQEQQNVSKNVEADLRQQLLANMPRDEMIRFSNGKSEHAIYVFTDTDCGYCRKLHQDVPYLTEHGVEVRYLAYPRAGLDSDTYNEMQAVWCADDRKKALTQAKSGEKIKSRDCNSPVARQYKAGQRLGIRGTPAIFLENGRELPGYVPPKQLLSILNGRS